MWARCALAALLVWPLLLSAGPARTDVEVAMFALPQSVWQDRFEGQAMEDPALWLRLNEDAAAGLAQMPVDLKCRLVGDEPVVQRKGAEEEFAVGWDHQNAFDERVAPVAATRRFIGTTVELAARQPASARQPLRLKMDFEHHVAAPQMRRYNYANAATGAERARLSVPLPQFEKLEWHGELTVSLEWQLVANILHRPLIPAKDAHPPMRFLIFIKRA